MHSKPEYLSDRAYWDDTLEVWIEPKIETIRENYDTKTIGSDAGTVWPWSQEQFHQS